MKTKKLVLALLFVPISAPAQTQPELLQRWKYDPTLPMNMQQKGVEERDGMRVQDMTYTSPVGDRGRAVGPNGGKVTAYLVIPDGKGPFPAVIYGHWCMPGSEKKNRTEFLEEALVLARAGVISLLPDHVTVQPGFVEEQDPFGENQVEAIVQQVVNLRRGADLLLARADVDPQRIAYVGHSCDAAAGGFLSGIDKRFKAFVLMAGDLSNEVDKKSKSFQEYRQKIGPERLDAFMKEHAWLDAGKYVSHAAPAMMFLQFAADEPFVDEEMEKGYFEVVSRPKKFKIYKAPHALNSEATQDRIAFLSEQLSFQLPSAAEISRIPALSQPPWPQ